MRSISLLSLAVLCLTILTAFTNLPSTHHQASGPTDPTVFKIMEVTYLWDLLKANYEPNRERDQTWLDVGLRSKYAMAKNYASLDLIEVAVGQPIFLRGPHQGDLDFTSTTSFGYYNPDFVTSLHQSLETALKNPMFKKVADNFYEKHLKSMAHTYYDAFLYLEQNPELRTRLTNDYLLAMAQPAGTMEGSLQEHFRGYAEQLEKNNSQADLYEAFTAPSFWLRRHIDGTADEYIALLEMAVSHFEGAK